MSPEGWEEHRITQATEDNVIRQKLNKAFKDLSQSWQDDKRRPIQSLFPLPLRLAPNLLRRPLPTTASDGYQGLVVEVDNIKRSQTLWLFARYRKEQGLRDEIRKWTAWSFGHACIDVALPTSRTAIIVGGAKRRVMEGHDQSREIALLASLKVQPPEWFQKGSPAPVEVVAQRSKRHLSPLLLNSILKREGALHQGPRLFNVTHNLPGRTTDSSDMNDFDETEWDHTEFEVDYILEKTLHDGEDCVWQSLSMETDRQVLQGGAENLTDMLPDTASMVNQQVLHFMTESAIRWMPSEGWHMHKDGVLHLPANTAIQRLVSRRDSHVRGPTSIKIRPNRSAETDYDVRSHKDLEKICQKQPWLLQALGQKHKNKTNIPQFRFLPLGHYCRPPSSRSPSPISDTAEGSGDKREMIGVVLVARAMHPCHSPAAPTNIWHKFGSYRATGIRTEPSGEPDGFFVSSYSDRDAVQSWTKSDCDFLLSHTLHA